MSGGAIVLTAVLGSVGYLLIAWVTVIVIAAKCAYDNGDLPVMAWWALAWPLALPVVLVIAAIGPIDRATKRLVRALNPNATGKWW